MNNEKPGHNKSFIYDNILGSMGERLIENVLKKRYQVYHYGYEFLLESISQLGKPERYNETLNMLQVHPDFIILSEKDCLPWPIEVKASRYKSLEDMFDDTKRGERGYIKLLNQIKNYHEVRYVNIIWNPERSDVKLYSGKIRKESGVEYFDLVKHHPRSLFTQEDLDVICQTVKDIPPPPKKYGK